MRSLASLTVVQSKPVVRDFDAIVRCQSVSALAGAIAGPNHLGQRDRLLENSICWPSQRTCSPLIQLCSLQSCSVVEVSDLVDRIVFD